MKVRIRQKDGQVLFSKAYHSIKCTDQYFFQISRQVHLWTQHFTDKE